jgi:rubrerythrin
MRMKPMVLSDLEQEARDEYESHMKRARRHKQANEYVAAIRAFGQAAAAAMTHEDEFLCRKLMEELTERLTPEQKSQFGRDRAVRMTRATDIGPSENGGVS